MGNKGRGGFNFSLVNVNVVYVIIIFRTPGGIYKKFQIVVLIKGHFSSFLGRNFFLIIFSVFIFRHLLFLIWPICFLSILYFFWCFLSQKKKLEQIKILY